MEMATLGAGTVMATVVEWGALLDTAIAALVGALVVTLAASTAIYGFATVAEMRREERGGHAAAAAVIALAGVLVFAAAIAVGLTVMIRG